MNHDLNKGFRHPTCGFPKKLPATIQINYPDRTRERLVKLTELETSLWKRFIFLFKQNATTNIWITSPAFITNCTEGI